MATVIKSIDTKSKISFDGVTNSIKTPELSDWECYLFGMGPGGIKVIPAVGNVPNVFWRWMQYLMLGNQWKMRDGNILQQPK